MENNSLIFHKELIRNKVNNLPQKPGVYQFIDQNNKIIYIGKAKNLKKRVQSYFTKKRFENNKLRLLLKKTSDINHIIVESESDALLLENNLIKKLQPKYNINLKDDKTFPWICIKNEPFPRIFSTRKYIEDGSAYYGPYTSAVTVRTLLSLIKKLYPIRTCNLNLSQNNINKKKFKICLEYHIGNCKGPCEKFQTENDYNFSISQIQHILKGNLKEIILYLEKLMRDFSEQYNFEKAQEIKEKIESLNKFQLKSTVVNNNITNVDVLSFVEDAKSAWINYIKVNNGAIIQTYSVELRKKLNEPKEILMEYALTEIRTRLKSDAKEILLPFKIENIPEGTKITIPIKGDKKKLLELSGRNARFFMLAQKQQRKMIKEKKSPEKILLTLKNDLKLAEIPLHIECIDNSNIHGSSAVASCVVFKNGIPSKKNYRKFNVKTVKGSNDPASMQEIVWRRYKGLIKNNENLPQLLIVDGGKPQLNAALKSLNLLQLTNKIAVIGIAKKLESIYIPNDPIPLFLNKNSESLKLIQKIRNEAHRFGISFHKSKRSQQMINTELLNIKGIGEKTIQILLNKLKSYENIKNADIQSLRNVVGEKKAILITQYFEM